MSNELFSPKDITTLVNEAADLKTSFEADDYDTETNISGHGAKLIAGLFNLLTAGVRNINFVSAGNLSLHVLLEQLIKYYGPGANLYISTWAVKEAPARSLLKMKDSGELKDLFGVFDYRIKTIDTKGFQLVEGLFNKYTLTKNHAKVLVLNYPYFSVTIVTSANLSNNPRIEAGIISTRTSTANFHMEWMKRVLNDQKIY